MNDSAQPYLFPLADLQTKGYAKPETAEDEADDDTGEEEAA